MDVDDTTRLIAKRLRAALQDANIPVEEAAQRAGMSASSLYRKLRGERHITLTELCYLSVVAGRDPVSFVRSIGVDC